MIKLKPIIFLPLEVGGVNISNHGTVFFGSESVYSMDFRDRTLRYRGFWRGAGMWSITGIDNLIVTGTKNGLIIFDETAIAHWTGSKTAVFSGNFSEEVKLLALSFYKEKGRRYLRVYPVGSEYFSGESKRLYSDTIIPFFTPFGGPVDYELIRYLRFLTNVFDVDGDGFDELVLVNPGVDSAYLVILSLRKNNEQVVKVDQEKLPSYTFRPILALKGDLDQDGLQEIALLSNPKYKTYHISMIDIVEGKINSQSLEMLDVHNVFKDVSEDGEAWLSVGDVNGDGFAEITFMWEEKPSWGEVKSKLFFLTKTFFGESEKSLGGIEVYPPLEMYTYDYDGDRKEELILVSALGIEAVNLSDGRVADFLPIIGEIKYLTHLGDERFFVSGSVLGEDVWSYYFVDGSVIKIGYPTKRVLKISRCNNEVSVLDASGKVWLINDNGFYLLKDSVRDLECLRDSLYLLLKDGKIVKYGVKTDREESVKSGKIVKLVRNEDKLFYAESLNGVISIKDLKDDKEIIKLSLTDDVETIVLLRKTKRKFLPIISTSNSLLLYDEKGKLVAEANNICIQNNNNYLKTVQKTKEMLLFLYNKSLYLVDYDASDKIRSLGYRGWHAIAHSNEDPSVIFLVYENGIYQATLDEVVKSEE